MTKPTKKLSLNKETVRTLSDREMSQAAGGVDQYADRTRVPAVCIGDGVTLSKRY